MASQEHLPGWFKLSLLPLLLIGAAAAYTGAHWGEIPERFPIHWGANGQPNHWLTRTPLHVFAIFIFAAGLCLWIILSAVLMQRGSRPSPLRTSALRLGFAVECFLAVIFSGAGVAAVVHFPIWIFVALIVPFTVVALLAGKEYFEPETASGDETGTEGDLFIPKRFGYGYALNFANPKAKWALAWILGGIGSLVVFLFLSLH